MELIGKIYYITRTWTDMKKGNSCAILRVVYAEMLKQLAPVVVVTPSYTGEERCTEEFISFSYNKEMMRKDIYLEYLRLKEDYLDSWVNKTFQYLKNIIGKNDVVYAATGGELGCIKLGTMLKEKCGCKLIVHFRDPIVGDILNGEKTVGYRGFQRTTTIDKYLENVDGFITYSEEYADWLRMSPRGKGKKIFSHYTGYSEKIQLPNRNHVSKGPLNIVYAGTASKIQNSEILYRSFRGDNRVKVTYICKEYEKMKSKMPEDNVQCIPLMSHDQFIDYMINEADVGFVSLQGKYTMSFVPSKIYEYINLGLPILASLQIEGAASKIINDGNYGIVCDSNNVEELQSAINIFLNKDQYNSFRKSILKDKDKWFYMARKEQFLSNMEEMLKG